MKLLLKKALLACPGFEALCRLLTRRAVRTLMYHRFTDAATGKPGCVDATTLRRQLDYLVRHHARWAPDDILSARDGRRPPGRCPVVVTVDDGYRDFVDVAYPLFVEHGIAAMLFVTTGFVDGQVWFWWDRLESILALGVTDRMIEVEVGGRLLLLDLSTPGGRKAAWHAVADRCRFVPDAEKEAALARLAADLQVTLPTRPDPLHAAATWEQIREMAAGGILLGAHAVTHPILSRVPLERARLEIEESRRRLGEMTGSLPDWFCYPQGGPADFTPQVRDLVEAAGYRGCFVAYQNQLEPEDAFALPRTCIAAEMADFRWFLCGAEILVLGWRRRLGLPVDLGAEYWAGSS
jgi:peptidoglycan/xylan/chitin deacetylase (PgdA/CDA1 family)